MSLCSRFFSVAMINHSDQNQLGRNGLFHFTLSSHNLASKEVRVEIQGKSSKQKP